MADFHTSSCSCGFLTYYSLLPTHYSLLTTHQNLCEHTRHASLPHRQAQLEGVLQFCGIQARIKRAFGGRRKSAAWHCLDCIGRNLERNASALSAVENEAGVAVPGSFTGGSQVIQPGQFRPLPCNADGMGGNVGQQIRSGGRADLVVDDAEVVARSEGRRGGK